jgi:large subunit ribosomal protein L31
VYNSKLKNLTYKKMQMKKDIHPNYVECEVSCACGNTLTVKSTESKMRLDVCSACHPFFTGSERMVDATGRVDKFKKKYGLK